MVEGLFVPDEQLANAVPRIPDAPLDCGRWRKVKTLNGSSPVKRVLLVANNWLKDGLDLPAAFALKRIDKALLLQDNTLGLRLENEIRLALLVSNWQMPNVVQIYGVWQDQRYFYLASEYCAGGEVFTALCCQGTSCTKQVWRGIAKQMLTSMDSLHSKGISHQDVSLENFLLTSSGVVKLIDFGAARTMDSTGGDAQSGSCDTFQDAQHASNMQAWLKCVKQDILQVGKVIHTIGTMGRVRKRGSNTHLISWSGSSHLPFDERGEADEDLASHDFLHLLKQLLADDPKLRPTAQFALQHQSLVASAGG